MMKRSVWRVLSALAVMIAVVFSTSGIAEAATACKFVVGIKYAGGKGHSSTVYAGIFECGKGKSAVRGQCIDPGKKFPVKASIKSGDKLPGMSVAQTAQVRYLWTKYSGTKNDQTAAALAISTWRYQNDSNMNKWMKQSYDKGKKLSDKEARKKRLITKGDMALSDRMMAEAKQNVTSGNWKMSIELQKVAFGQADGVGKIVIRDAKSKPVAGVQPSLTLSKNAKVTAAVGKTDASGAATFKFTVTTPGEVKADAKAKQPTGAKWTNYKSNVQRLVVGYKTRDVKASAKYVTGPKHEVSSVCDSNCDGIAKVTFTGKLEAGEAAARYTFFTDKKVWTTFDVPSGGSISKTVDIPDATVVSGSVVYLDKAGSPVGKPIALSKYEVVCPPWLEVDGKFDVDCDCNLGMMLNLAAPGGARYYVATVQVDGKTKYTEKLGNSGSKSVSVALDPGSHLVVSFKAFADKDYKKQLPVGKSSVMDMRWF